MTTTTRSTIPAPVPDGTALPRVRWGAVVLFAAIALGLAWLIVLPLWLGDGLRSPLVIPLTTAVMTAPTIAALVVVLGVMRTRSPGRFLGLVPTGRWRSIVVTGVLGAVGAVLLTVVAVLLGSAAGLVHVRLTGSSGTDLLMLPVLTVLIAIAAVGEEIGWRGFLLPALRPLGTWPALVITGVVWGVWHAPLVLLGYNYGTTDPLAMLPMVVTTVLIGVVIGWMRLRTSSVYPGALTHGALNASATLVLAALVPPAQSDPAVTVLGWVGWILLAAVIAVIVAARGFRRIEPVRDLARPTRSGAE